jgi:hypothetical protein
LPTPWSACFIVPNLFIFGLYSSTIKLFFDFF